MSSGRERSKFWRAEEFGDLELLRATYFTHSFARHTHAGYALGVIETGTEEFWYRGAVHRAPAGSIALINPDEVHTGHAADRRGWSYRVLYPGVELLRRAASEVAGRPRGVPLFPEPVVRDAPLARLLRELHAALERSGCALERESRLVWTLTQLVARHAAQREPPGAPKRERRAVRLAREYVEDNHAHNISLEELSRVAGLSRFHLLRSFRAEVGLPPHSYLNQVRVYRVKEPLRSGAGIAEAALETGFADQSHLTRHFKRLVGVPPGRYALGSKNVQDISAPLL
jgi:AraC-like DNA-binding protein